MYGENKTKETALSLVSITATASFKARLENWFSLPFQTKFVNEKSTVFSMATVETFYISPCCVMCIENSSSNTSVNLPFLRQERM